MVLTESPLGSRPDNVGTVLVWVAVAVLVGLTVWGVESAASISSNFRANTALTESAPQQQVAAAWAIKDAEVQQVALDGLRDGLLGAGLIVLIIIARRLPRRARPEIEEAPRRSEGLQAES